MTQLTKDKEFWRKMTSDNEHQIWSLISYVSQRKFMQSLDLKGLTITTFEISCILQNLEPGLSARKPVVQETMTTLNFAVLQRLSLNKPNDQQMIMIIQAFNRLNALMLRYGLADHVASPGLSDRLKRVIRAKLKDGKIDNIGYAMLVKELGNVDKEPGNILKAADDSLMQEVLS